MKFTLYLNEASNRSKVIYDEIETIEQVENVREILSKQCSEIYNFYKLKGEFFFRGAKRNNDAFLLETPYQNRAPKDTPQDVSKLLDDAFERKFGWRPRSQGVFGVSNFDTARLYGQVYILFPVDGFKYVYSATIKDLYLHLRDMGYLGYTEESLYALYQEIVYEIQKYVIKRKRVRIGGDKIQFTPGTYLGDELYDIAKEIVDKHILKDNFFKYSLLNRLNMYDKMRERLMALASEIIYEKNVSFEEFKEEYVDGFIFDLTKATKIVKSYRADSLENAADSESEVMFHCKKYYLLIDSIRSKRIKDNDDSLIIGDLLF
jgi:hypothetical protein